MVMTMNPLGNVNIVSLTSMIENGTHIRHIYEDFDSIPNSKTDYCNQCFINAVYID